MLDELKKMLSELDEAIEYSSDLGLVYTKYHYCLIVEKRAIKRTIKRIERIERRLQKSEKI